MAAKTDKDGNTVGVTAGKGNLATGEAPPLDGEVRIGSNTKTFVAVVIMKMVEEGKAVIIISSELEEILGVSDRIYTLAYGRITGEVKADDATQENLMELMTIEPAREEQK